MVRRPKSSATVVVVLPITPDRSSIPTDRSVIAASVCSTAISEAAPTNVVLPAPNPPAITTLTGTGTLIGLMWLMTGPSGRGAAARGPRPAGGRSGRDWAGGLRGARRRAGRRPAHSPHPGARPG